MAKVESLLNLPRVAVCLAAFNGARWIAEQVNSIVTQEDVSVTVFVSVDASVDGTEVWFNELTQKNCKIVVLPNGKVFGSAARNFFRLLIDIDFSLFDYISFADQDDIWKHDKLTRHIKLIQRHGVDGVSSNVLAFWPDGRSKLIDKSQPQREIDYIFESAGPGCSFLMKPCLVNEVKRLLVDPSSLASQVALHDWLVYAVCRASGKRWLIDSKASLHYRQHDENVVGANSGFKAKLVRFQKIFNGWYKAEVLKVLAVSYQISNDPKLLAISKLLTKSDLLSRFKLLFIVPQARRKLSDRVFFALIIIFGLF